VDKLEKKSAIIFAGQQQQNPAVTGGTVFKRAWFEHTYYDALPPLIYAQARAGCITFDCAFKKLEDSAFVCGLAMLMWENDIFILPKMVHDRLTFTETLTAVKFMAETYPFIGAKLIEDKANGTAVIEVLKSQIRGVIPVEVKNDSKEGRAQAVAYLPQAGNVRLPNPKIWPWVLEFVNELATFPRGTYKDYVDSFTQGLYYFETLHKGELGEDAAGMMSEGRENVREWRKVF
jgi:predicted phage terminase large subunit-like protein